MICPKCDSTLAVSRTERRRDCESRDLLCMHCGYRASSLTILLQRPQKNPKGTTSRTLVALAEEGIFDEVKEKLRKMLPRGD